MKAGKEQATGTLGEKHSGRRELQAQKPEITACLESFGGKAKQIRVSREKLEMRSERAQEGETVRGSVGHGGDIGTDP